MRALETEIAIRGTPEQVWTVLIDFKSYPQWNPFIREASGKTEKGFRLKVKIYPPDGNPMTFHPTVLDAVPSQRLRWLGHLWIPGLFDGEHDFRIEQASPGQSRFRQREQFRGILVNLFPNAMYEKTKRGFEAMNRALKERVEKLYA